MHSSGLMHAPVFCVGKYELDSDVGVESVFITACGDLLVHELVWTWTLQRVWCSSPHSSL